MRHSFISTAAHNVTKHGMSDGLSIDAQMIMLVELDDFVALVITGRT